MNKSQLNINLSRLQKNISDLAEIGKFGNTGVCRIALSKEDKEGIEFVKKRMEDAGLETKIDSFGNLIGRLNGNKPNSPILMIGSHIDSQPYGGRFDGTIGVLGGIEVLQTMQDNNITPNIPIEIISFCDEEGYRFNKGLFGSRGITSMVNKSELDLTDNDGITRIEALKMFGTDTERLHESEYAEGSIESYLEMHIEQGPVLESLNAPIGIVTGISGPLWLTVELTGYAGHSGSVPMHLRNDALVGAAEIIVKLNQIVKQDEGVPTVGTIGNISVFPNARAVIPEKVVFTVDLRDINLERRNRYESQLRKSIEETAKSHGLNVLIKEDTNSNPKFCQEEIIKIMRDSSEELGLKNVPELMSGPFHDALSMAEICPIGMIFVQSKDGISHNPDEFSTYEDIAIGTELLFQTAIQIATNKKVK